MKKENKNESAFGMIGLGTMGSNLLQNIADHGYNCSGYDNDSKKVDTLNNLGKENIQGFSDIKDFAKNLKSPKTVMMLVPAGKIVDTVIAELLEVLEKGDIIIDGGNSHFTDTEIRYKELEQKGYHFIGMGVSGGEEGARKGPSMMPGGDKEAYKTVAPLLQKIAAHVGGDPTVAYMGERSAGHYVKMVHNGIEYAIMQLLAETYEVMQHGLKMKDEEIHKVFEEWNEGRLQSYLMEITRDIFAFKEPGEKGLLLNKILGEAKANGTGKWTSQSAMDLNLPVPIIDTAVSFRYLSKFKEQRTKAWKLYPDVQEKKFSHSSEDYIKSIEHAFYFAMVTAYAQGMHLLYEANEVFDYKMNLDTIAKIWRGGCIIRSAFLEDIYTAYQKDGKLVHLYLDDSIQHSLSKSVSGLRKLVSDAALHGIGLPAFSSALAYFDNFREEEMPANLIMAQRDYFGAHTYELKGREGTFHTEWEAK